MSRRRTTLRKSAAYLGLTAAFTAILSVTAFAAEVSPVKQKTPESSVINFPPIEYGGEPLAELAGDQRLQQSAGTFTPVWGPVE